MMHQTFSQNEKRIKEEVILLFDSIESYEDGSSKNIEAYVDSFLKIKANERNFNELQQQIAYLFYQKVYPQNSQKSKMDEMIKALDIFTDKNKDLLERSEYELFEAFLKGVQFLFKNFKFKDDSDKWSLLKTETQQEKMINLQITEYFRFLLKINNLYHFEEKRKEASSILISIDKFFQKNSDVESLKELANRIHCKRKRYKLDEMLSIQEEKNETDHAAQNNPEVNQNPQPEINQNNPVIEPIQTVSNQPPEEKQDNPASAPIETDSNQEQNQETASVPQTSHTDNEPVKEEDIQQAVIEEKIPAVPETNNNTILSSNLDFHEAKADLIPQNIHRKKKRKQKANIEIPQIQSEDSPAINLCIINQVLNSRRSAISTNKILPDDVNNLKLENKKLLETLKEKEKIIQEISHDNKCYKEAFKIKQEVVLNNIAENAKIEDEKNKLNAESILKVNELKGTVGYLEKVVQKKEEKNNELTAKIVQQQNKLKEASKEIKKAKLSVNKDNEDNHDNENEEKKNEDPVRQKAAKSVPLDAHFVSLQHFSVECVFKIKTLRKKILSNKPKLSVFFNYDDIKEFKVQIDIAKNRLSYLTQQLVHENQEITEPLVKRIKEDTIRQVYYKELREIYNLLKENAMPIEDNFFPEEKRRNQTIYESAERIIRAIEPSACLVM